MDPDDEEDDCNSNLSSLSVASACASSVGGLSSSGYYEDELNSIRQLIKRQGSKNVEPCKSFNKDLNEQLISALKLNEEYKNRLYKLEFEEHCKFKDMLEKNARLSKDLEYANNLIKNCNTSSEINYELYKEVTYWKNEHIKLKSGQDKLLLENRKLLKELEESKQELNTKILGNKELKKKITEQHVENQITLQAKLGLFNELQSKLTELEFVKKSEEWYKLQLKQTQVDKQKINEELTCLKNLHINKTRQIESLQLEIQQQRGLYNELEFNYKKQLKEQEEQQKRQLNRTEKHKEYANNLNVNVKKQEQQQKEELKKQQQEDDLQEIEIELTKVKQSLKEQHLLFNELNTKYADLSARNVFMQKTLNDKESTIDNLRNDLSKSNNKLSLINQELKQAYSDLSQLKLDKDKLQLHLNAALFEKNQTDSLINSIRKDFNKFVDKYNQLIKELKEKENTICGLQKEKQELFMNHNWQVCELEEAKNKLLDLKSKHESIIIENDKLKEELTIINQIQTTNNLNNLKHNQQNQHLVSEIKNLDENVLEQERQLQFNENNIRMLFEQDEKFKCFHNFNPNKKEIEDNEEAMNYNNNKAGGNVNNKLKRNEDQSLGIYVLNYLYLLTCKYSKNIDDEANEEAAKRKEEDGNRDLMMETLNSLRIKIGEILSDIYVRKRTLFEQEQGQGQGMKEEKGQELKQGQKQEEEQRQGQEEQGRQGIKEETGQEENQEQGQRQILEEEQRQGPVKGKMQRQEQEQGQRQKEELRQKQRREEGQGQGKEQRREQGQEEKQGHRQRQEEEQGHENVQGQEEKQGQRQRQGEEQGLGQVQRKEQEQGLKEGKRQDLEQEKMEGQEQGQEGEQRQGQRQKQMQGLAEKQQREEQEQQKKLEIQHLEDQEKGQKEEQRQEQDEEQQQGQEENQGQKQKEGLKQEQQQEKPQQRQEEGQEQVHKQEKEGLWQEQRQEEKKKQERQQQSQEHEEKQGQFQEQIQKQEKEGLGQEQQQEEKKKQERQQQQRQGQEEKQGQFQEHIQKQEKERLWQEQRQEEKKKQERHQQRQGQEKKFQEHIQKQEVEGLGQEQQQEEKKKQERHQQGQGQEEKQGQFQEQTQKQEKEEGLGQEKLHMKEQCCRCSINININNDNNSVNCSKNVEDDELTKKECEIKLLDNLNVLNDEISYLKTKLKVMERDKIDYQRKHEKINRTLLKKLKEHIKGRHSAEKSLLYLQKQTELIEENANKNNKIAERSINVENVEEEKENDKNRKSDFCSSIEDSLEVDLKSIVNKSQAKLPSLTNDLELCKSELRHKNNEIIALNARIADLVKVKERADDAHEKLVNLFKLQIANLQESVLELKKEKTVMESVCQDLKLALNSKKSINQNSICKKCRINMNMNMNTIEEKEYSSLPSSFPLLPSPSIFDDTYIVHLMQLSNNSQQQSSSSSSSSLQPPLDLLRHHLDSLKEEVSELAKVTATATAATTK